MDTVAGFLRVGAGMSLTHDDPANTLTISVTDAWSYASLASDSASSATTLSDVAGLVFTSEANLTYEVEVFGSFQTSALTTGLGLALNIPSGSVFGFAMAQSAIETPMLSSQNANNATLAPTTAVGASNTPYPIFGKYLVSIGANGGPVQLRLRSEIASSAAILRAGTRMKWRAI